jgi:hypothetical protein
MELVLRLGELSLRNALRKRLASVYEKKACAGNYMYYEKRIHYHTPTPGIKRNVIQTVFRL